MAKLLLKILFKTLKVLFTVFAIVAMIVIISQRVTNNKLRLFGYGVYTVISESMLPEYEIGDMFLAKEVQKDDVVVGDDIVYIGEVDSYKDKVITHRIIRIEEDESIVTKGINNDMEDPPIQFKQVYGKVTGRLIVLSLFSKLMNNNILFYIIIFVPFTILIFLDTKDLFNDKKKKEEKEKTQDKPVTENNEVKESAPVVNQQTMVQPTQSVAVNNTVSTTAPVNQQAVPQAVPQTMPQTAPQTVPSTVNVNVATTIPVVNQNINNNNVVNDNRESEVKEIQENKE